MTLDETGVVRWEPTTSEWTGHRPEPLIAERLWACPLLGAPAPNESGWVFEAGFDARGRPVAHRSSMPGQAPFADVTHYGDGVITTKCHMGTTIRTELDDAGRPVRTTYTGDTTGAERYRYDDAGRLVEIDGAYALWAASLTGVRFATDERLAIEHDDRGPVRIVRTDYPALVWERNDTPLEATLERGGKYIADSIVREVEHACDKHRLPSATEVFCLCLTYVNQGPPYPTIEFGLEDDRRRVLDGRSDRDEVDVLWYPMNGDHPLSQILGDEPLDHALLELVFREAALKQREDPHRAVIAPAAAMLARRDWSGLLTLTDDFVVFFREHDDDVSPSSTVRQVNPPERLAAWDANWPAQVPR